MKTFILVHQQARSRAKQAIDEAPDGMVVTIKEPTRSSAENALLHALLGEIAATKEWAGKKRSVDVWRRLQVAAWCRATGRTVEILPALDGHGIDVVYHPTSSLGRGECADLITWIQAWMAHNP